MNESNQDTSNNSEIKLLDRNEKIQMGKEWDYVQNFYMDQQKALSKNPTDNEAKLNLVELFVKEARVTGEHGHYYPAALKLTDEIMVAIDVKEDIKFRAMVARAGVLLSLHEFSKALEVGNEAVALNPMNAQIYGVLIDANVELGNYKEAVAMADKMMSIKPDIRSYSRISYLREIHGDVDGAKEAMSMAIKSGYPGYEETAWAMLTLGNLYVKYGDLETADNIYDQILQTRENYPFAIAAKGEVQYLKGDLAAAEKTINEAINIIPEVGYYVQLAQIYKDQDRNEELDPLMKEIFAMLADDEQAGHNMNLEYAQIYRDILNDQDQALEYVMKEYKKRPENIDVNKELASVYLEKGNRDSMKQHIAQASVTNSKDPVLVQLKSNS